MARLDGLPFEVLPDRAKGPRGSAALVLATLDNVPFVAVDDLRTMVGLGWGALYHHLRRLEAQGLIQSARFGRCRIVFSRTRSHVEDAAVHVALRAETAGRLAEALWRSPGRDVPSLAREADVPLRLAYYHLRHLVDDGLVLPRSPNRLSGLVSSRRLSEYFAVQDAALQVWRFRAG